MDTLSDPRPAATHAGLLAGWWARLRCRRHMRATQRALAALDDRTLSDLGLGRSELLSLAAECHELTAASRLRVWREGGC
jgi:uncharacterized protein YjiS (DUF1127 family)